MKAAWTALYVRCCLHRDGTHAIRIGIEFNLPVWTRIRCDARWAAAVAFVLESNRRSMIWPNRRQDQEGGRVIAQLEGTIVDVGAEEAVISVNGIGFAVRMPSSDLSRLHAGTQVLAHTHLAVSQEAVSLYGFLDGRSKDLFLSLQKVPGVGPRAALALLSVMNADQLLEAISSQDVTALTKAKGVGKRGAQKIILEMSGKIADLDKKTDTAQIPKNIGEVIDGLVSLGWHEDQARAAVETVMGQMADSTDSSGDIEDAQVPDVLRRSLALLGRRMK